MKQITKRTVCGDTLWEAVHESGLRVMIYPKEKYSTTYAMFSTAYGSIDETFARGDEDFVTVPAGIAHYLEHKMFENEGEDAFERYARTGASANAYTTFDKTCYLFSCSKRFMESLEILLDFVQRPYFTPETVQKEQGIIAQEIRMGEDHPAHKLIWNLLEDVYESHPVRISIAGTVESIAKIDDQLLYRCYHTFYHPSNMVVTVAGNADPEAVLALVDRMVPTMPAPEIRRQFPQEPRTVMQKRRVETAPVALPMFAVGYKEDAAGRKTEEELSATDLLLRILIGNTSPLYRRLQEQGLVNDEFDAEYLEGPGYAMVMVSGESCDPDRVVDELNREVARLRREGIPEEDFECARRAAYGCAIAAYSNVGTLCNVMTDCALGGRPFGVEQEILHTMTRERVEQRLQEELDPDRMAVSILVPPEEF
ncbi:MAG: insulinase family protein [Clostridia bacterium]|nr:insulinase family protein [Clostridia bacterium]